MMEEALLADLVTALPPAIRLQRAVQVIKTHFACSAVAILRLQVDQLVPVAVEGLVQETLGRRFRIALHPRFAAILAQREPIRFIPGTELPDPYDGLLANQEGAPLPVHDCMGAALFVEGSPWGVLTLDSLAMDTFNEGMRLELGRHIILLEAAIRMTRLEEEVRSLRNQPEQFVLPVQVAAPEELIGRSQVLQHLLQELNVVAPSDLPVLLLGETGVGKELFARYIHRHSLSTGPLIHVNCAALPETLAESELFGHVRGAFSGANSDRSGRFEAAEGGTLFLDEVGELPLTVQAKLLRTLQNGEIQRLGEDHPRKIQVRIIAATNRDLKQAIKDGGYRADLYHRLSVFPIPIPPLRERDKDILLLAGHFLELNRARMGLRSIRLSAASELLLLRYSWPGNVRELEHVISRATIKAVSRGAKRSDIVTLEPALLDLDDVEPVAHEIHSNLVHAAIHSTLQQATDNFQRKCIEQELGRQNSNWAKTARILGMDASNLHKLARRLSLK